MTYPSPRRFRRLYEQILLSRPFSIAIGCLVAVILPCLAAWSKNELLTPDGNQKTTILVATLAYLGSHLANMHSRNMLPAIKPTIFMAPQTLLIYSLSAAVTLILNLEASLHVLMASGVLAILWQYLEYTCTHKHRRWKMAVIPGGRYTEEILKSDFITPFSLERLELDRRYDGVVADFDRADKNIEKFLAQCALNRTAVYDAKYIYEWLTGRTKINRMTENNIGATLPSPGYERTKQIIDILIVVFSLPVVLPIGLITALLIKLESPGPTIYTQTRIGQGNKPFTIYKFRSMRFDRDAPEQFAGENDPRITRVGKIIRKLRIDELPQFLNILKGEMSLIGPRPEQPSFVQEYEQKLPFYNYRHIMKPGISGWAQVRHGYTASIDETQIKIEHDFYYIKHCSLALDLIVAILTVRIMLTGFGAR
ncbi:hypothetical protein AAV94_11615 [Lampropedia cohaerens]|uniref:Bacterial sugar transferase domain-containing protein n=1 Tax=Lampropedia cohaerens TaxID=1610491 RepID=A0A0U1PXK1_9BURK|nr:exopolysaccharide biosynthesis polyprenyl glycosylphosphotransferase [Lampropedia cohaerens]KKW67230.1 hypothetical protein AAV94_11615 [Lampropedia cohaerens]